MSSKSTEAYYFERYAEPPIIPTSWQPPADTSIGIVLPSFNELDTHKAIQCLISCKQIIGHVIILVIINHAQDASARIKETNLMTKQQLEELSIPDRFTLHTKLIELPNKKAGVGLARKIGMDQVARWFQQLNKNGPIVCFDADSTCSSNYLQEIEKAYYKRKADAAIISYEHPLDPLSGIITYELHLRYYVNALRFVGFPNAFQTLGSCITVSAQAYVHSGGMNTRKAGEDFYFLHKIAKTVQIEELADCFVYPSDRLSDRVPFGTGKALADFRKKGKLLTYPMSIFQELEQYFSARRRHQTGTSDTIPDSLSHFEELHDFQSRLIQIKTQSKTEAQYIQRLFEWWDGFKILKYVHYRRDQGVNMISVVEAIHALNQVYWKHKDLPHDETELLKRLREIDINYSRSNKFLIPEG
ncbi:MAG: hypothetical protein ACI92W_000228 [Paraglaciecola sp.]|jgi:hypothetical protein